MIKIFLSIIIPIYNKMPYLENTINSMIKNNINDIDCEIILVNDRSSKQDLDFIKKCQIKNKIIINLQTNFGQSAARNIGFHHSKEFREESTKSLA